MHITIIGDGLIGLFSAYYLKKNGHNVVIIGKQKAVESASIGNAGMICPSHFVPLAAPGIIWTGIKWMFNNESPLLFHPKLDIDFIRWCLGFIKNASKTNVRQNQGLLSGLLEWSKSLYLELEKDEVIPGIEKKGILMACNSHHGLEEEIEASQTAKKLNIQTTLLDKQEIEKANPGISFSGIGGVLYTGDMQTDPKLMVNALKTYLQKIGVEFIDAEVIDFSVENQSIKSIICNDQTRTCETVAICGGLWSSTLAKKLNYSLLLQGGKGYNITIPDSKPNITIPMILVESRVALTPLGTSLRLGGTMELGGQQSKINQSRIDGILKNTEKYLPDFKANDLAAIPPWYGYRPLTTNGMPVIKKIINLNNAYVNAGHGMLGLSLAPASGLLLENLINHSN